MQSEHGDKKSKPQPERGDSSPGQEAAEPAPLKRKLSTVLLEFIDTYRGCADSDDELFRLIAAAVVAWDACVVPPERSQHFINGAVDLISSSGDTEGAEDFRGLVATLMRRKKRVYDSDTRFIVTWKLIKTDTGHDLLVNSMPEIRIPPG